MERGIVEYNRGNYFHVEDSKRAVITNKCLSRASYLQSFSIQPIYVDHNEEDDMRTHLGRNGNVVVWCDYCASTTEFTGLRQAEEKVQAQGWTVHHGKTRCPACTESERIMLARSVWRSSPR
jgi:hypothetical protein